MRKIVLSLVLCFSSLFVIGQTVTLTPTITPALFQPTTTITVKYDVTGTSLANLSQAWIWVWIPGTTINAKYNFNPASSNTAQTDNAKFTKSVVDGRTLFTITFKPSDFFATSIATQTQLGLLLKGNDWTNGQTSDYIATLWDGSFQVKLNAPSTRPLFVSTGEQIQITAETPVVATYELFINDVSVNTTPDVTNFSYMHTVAESSGGGKVKVRATSGQNSSTVEFQYVLSTNSVEQVRPAEIISGINYNAGDPTEATLCLLAPGKTSAYVLGDFSNWEVVPQNLMKRDGEFFWIELTGLTAGQEYAFQYLLDESIYVADPYADKILDPDDQFIPATTYPNLKTFPQKALKTDWYFNRLAVLQTQQTPYTWQVNNFQKPEKEKLVVYELLIRDFFANGSRNYANLIDTLSYIKKLGVNAIELMPIMEFNGNESWGYNPTFMFAPDKYYGTKNMMKQFVDACHQNGIAVILDIAMNHQDLPNPYVLMDFNFTSYKPSATNKWFNTDARHPFNVFFDMNHESLYTKKYLDTVNYHWLNEYKVDGFRFDLSKGFTQVNNPGNVSAWSAYDASRVAILKRMADKIWSHSPDAYVILEHLAVNAEEKELAEYRAAEGKGMMLWGKMTEQYNQLTMGYEDNSDISGIYHETRGWTAPRLVGYMESHDEERLMVKNILYGKVVSGYSTKEVEIALERMKAAATVFYTIPGPKMLWQFGELGYDLSINYCPDGTVNQNCRVSPKPVKWEYREDAARHELYAHIGDLNRLRQTYDVFSQGTATIPSGASLTKVIGIKNKPYTATPASADEMNAVVVANFDVTDKSMSVAFPHTGTWYDYYSAGRTIDVASLTSTMTIPKGEYKIFTDYPIENPLVTGVEESGGDELLSVFPNPAKETITIELAEPIIEFEMYTQHGIKANPLQVDDQTWDVKHLNSGFYVGVVRTKGQVYRVKLLKK
jgi:1,4-alpha-glucan branching enzyme